MPLFDRLFGVSPEDDDPNGWGFWQWFHGDMGTEDELTSQNMMDGDNTGESWNDYYQYGYDYDGNGQSDYIDWDEYYRNCYGDDESGYY